jgi:rare lipoprotein A
MKRIISILIITITALVFSADASFYGGKLHGSMTASGERFNQYDFTAAHKQLPLNSIVEVTNPRNGKSVRVRINDRGPYIKGRSIDLSASAFEAIEDPQRGIIKDIIIKIITIGDNKRDFSQYNASKKSKNKKVKKIITNRRTKKRRSRK